MGEVFSAGLSHIHLFYTRFAFFWRSDFLPYSSHSLPAMFSFIRPSLLRALLVGFVLLLSIFSSWGQNVPTAPHGYDFLTVTSIESLSKKYSKLLITPAYQGKSEMPLEGYMGLGAEKFLDTSQRNTLITNQLLSDLTAAGWDLVEVYVTPAMGPTNHTTRYLFRKAKS